MLKTNKDKIVEMLLPCKPGPPRVGPGWKVDHLGKPFLLPGIGGITLNVQVGDPAFGLAGDHIEPGVSCTANADKPNDFPNNSLQILSCVGNEARIVSGEAKGKTGTVIGHHGGSEHIIVDFARKIKAVMSYDDNILVRAMGQGLELMDYPDIKLFNLSPDLLEKMKVVVGKKGVLQVPVTTMVPAPCMGSGVGRAHVGAGDYDVMTSDPGTVKKYGLDRMRFGDIVALMDHDNSFGRAYVKGAVSIGIVVHSDCRLAGHGPGISTLMTCPKKGLEPVLDPGANIADLFGIGTRIESGG
ncbi:DUF4438 domain-containing protein [Desulfospira joergensenii]|uniref:DUF4438 domain-containing protein n=1 Tax=Desulfospira joergensenii TaxID=53329 RepID=UPI0003B3EA8A|nr:DUF4438 domain-containing protein [Desulfospira joergensenii]